MESNSGDNEFHSPILIAKILKMTQKEVNKYLCVLNFKCLGIFEVLI